MADLLADWPDLAADARGLGRRYEEADWRSLLLEPTSCGIDTGERPGVVATVPAGPYESVDDAVGTGPFGTSHVLWTETGGHRQYLIAVEARTQELVVVVPVVLARDAVSSLRERVAEMGSIHTHIEPPAGDRRVTVSHADPSLFFD